jgi:uncharacterized membrane protein SpoIIM required for sporulation/ABC-type transport system involved in multi-copper enzyme maturation permease subunit
MLASLSPALIITRREMRDQFRDWRIIFPVLVLTLIFPGLMNFTAGRLVAFVTQYGAPLIGDRLIPFLLMIVGFFPVSVSLVIALESFVGEKERRSIEPLLSSPLLNWQIYLGKLLAAVVPSLLASYLGIGVYLIGVYQQIGWTAPPQLLVQILALTTVQAVVMVSGAVVVSSQTTSTRAANLLASFIIIPMALLIQGESMVMFWARYDALWLIIGGQALLAWLLVRTGVSHFNREELLGREMDVVNLGWTWRTFRQAFTGGKRNIWQWYRTEVPAALGRLRLPALFVTAALLIGLGAGASQARIFVLPEHLLSPETLQHGFADNLRAISLLSTDGVRLVWLHNLRALAIATVLGIFSFGVLGVLVVMLPMVIIGYLLASVAQAGLSPLTFAAALVAPHGVLEIPAMIIVGAAVLRLGATLAAPARGQTIGEAWLSALADWAKVFLGVALPLLLAAALVEVLLTPHLAVLILNL